MPEKPNPEEVLKAVESARNFFDEEKRRLAILCDKPLMVYVGEEEISIHPATSAQLEAVEPFWPDIEKATEIKTKSDAKKCEEAILNAMVIFLAPRGQVTSKYTMEDLKKGLTRADQRRILSFIRETSGLGELAISAMATMGAIRLSENGSDGPES